MIWFVNICFQITSPRRCLPCFMKRKEGHSDGRQDSASCTGSGRNSHVLSCGCAHGGCKKRNGLSTLTWLCHKTARGSKEGQGIMSTAMSDSEGAGRPTWKHSSPGSYGKVSLPIVKASIAPTVPLGHACSSLNCVFASPGAVNRVGRNTGPGALTAWVQIQILPVRHGGRGISYWSSSIWQPSLASAL